MSALDATSPVGVLVIDDDPAVLHSVEEALLRAGYRVECAANGLEAEGVLAAFSPDLVICDLVMPEKDGIETIRDIRSSNKTVKIIAISGGGRYGADLTLADALEAGADTTIGKPFGIRELLETVSGSIESRAKLSHSGDVR